MKLTIIRYEKVENRKEGQDPFKEIKDIYHDVQNFYVDNKKNNIYFTVYEGKCVKIRAKNHKSYHLEADN